ncbi:MAG: SDR family NAD(P)-dependent oxidoreductase [Elusimicrobiota bacterium]
MKKVLVTGAGGFIGSHLAEELARQGLRVRALVRYNGRNDWGHLEKLPKELLRRIEVLPGDVTDPFFMDHAIAGMDTVFHLAALIAIPFSYSAPERYVATNIQGTLNVLQACRRHKVKRMLHTSTSEVYGTARYTPIDEEHPLQGQSPYSASKIGADKIVESFYRSFGLPVTTVRPFNTFGPRQSARAVIPTMMSQLLSGNKELALGDLKPVRDFNFVRDTAEGFIALAKSPRAIGETVNLGSGRGVSILETLRLIEKITGSRLRVRKDARRIRPQKSEVFKLIASNAKARKLSDWKPRFSLEEGLRLTLDYVRTHLDEYKTNIYNL